MCALTQSRSVSSASVIERDRRLALRRPTTEDPVVRAHQLWDRDTAGLVTHHRHDPLVARSRVLELLGAHLRLQGIGADHEQERVGAFDGLAHLAPPLGAWWQAFPVDPHVAALLAQLFVQPAHEDLVLAR